MTQTALLFVQAHLPMTVNAVRPYALLVNRTIRTDRIIVGASTVTRATIPHQDRLPLLNRMVTLHALDSVVLHVRAMGKYNVATLRLEENPYR